MTPNVAVLQRLLRYSALTAGVVGTAAAVRYQQVIKRQEQELPKETLPLKPSSSSSDSDHYDVIIIGGGVVGIATAYACANTPMGGRGRFSTSRKPNVLVIEPNTLPGQECTACAAGGMQRSNPVVSSSTWWAVLKSLWGQADYHFFHMDWKETLTDPFFLRWLWTFTKTSLLPPSDDQQRQQSEMLKFTQFAIQEMTQFMQQNRRAMAHISGYNPKGSLSLHYEGEAPSEGEESSTFGRKSIFVHNPAAGSNNQEPYQYIRSTNEILKLEPSLRFQVQQAQANKAQNDSGSSLSSAETKFPVWAKFEHESAAASAERYTMELANQCTQYSNNITFLYNTTVRSLQFQEQSEAKDKAKMNVTGLATTAGVIPVGPQTQVIVATGAWVPHLLATANLYAPVYPLKGYAISLSAKDILSSSKLKESDLPSRIVADAYMFTSRLGPDEIRITSIGELSGWSTQPTPAVDQAFRQEAARQFPQLAPYLPTAPTRCGHRPYVNDGLVLLGQCVPYSNLWVSCGPGSNGWKMAMGSGTILAQLAVAQKSPAQVSSELGFDVSVFTPETRVVWSPWFTKFCRARWNL